ncbi:hypothetical protein F5Y05DRAFT_146803 [Hypoxylon sp. FL0543]|nr:hypothetical protein F5Y05DRAFT_146803 [Hypoxylon sp. FL0543]
MGFAHSKPTPEPPMTPAPKPKPLFVCGPLCALPLLAWVLTKDSSNVDAVSALARPAKIYGYAPFTLLHCSYPAVIKHNPRTWVVGYLLILDTAAQRRKLERFLGDTSTMKPVAVMLIDGHGDATEEIVEADLHVWSGDEKYVMDKPWSLDEFIDKSLDYWLRIFERSYISYEDDEEA